MRGNTQEGEYIDKFTLSLSLFGPKRERERWNLVNLVIRE
jgi:hypothetical protein